MRSASPRSLGISQLGLHPFSSALLLMGFLISLIDYRTQNLTVSTAISTSLISANFSIAKSEGTKLP